MYEVHLALIAAVVALIIAVRRQPRLPEWGLQCNAIEARHVLAEQLRIGASVNGGLHLYVDKADGKTNILFPYDVSPGESRGEAYQVSLRCGRGLGGFRIEFILESPDFGSHQFLALGFEPGKPEVLLFDGCDTVIARLPLETSSN